MPNDFQRVMDSLLKDIPFTNCYILIASKGSLEEHKMILWKFLNSLENKNMAVKWEKCAFFQKRHRMAEVQNIPLLREPHWLGNWTQ